jgi:hypothetical protein
MRVRAPDGKTWVVRRRWMPKRPRLRRRVRANDVIQSSNWDIPDLGGIEELGPLGIVVGIVGALLFVLVVSTVLIPFLALTIELILVIILFGAGLIGRLLLGRPWRIEATTSGPPEERREIEVAGLRESAQAARDLAKDLEAGHQRARLVP